MGKGLNARLMHISCMAGVVVRASGCFFPVTIRAFRLLSPRQTSQETAQGALIINI